MNAPLTEREPNVTDAAAEQQSANAPQARQDELSENDLRRVAGGKKTHIPFPPG